MEASAAGEEMRGDTGGKRLSPSPLKTRSHRLGLGDTLASFGERGGVGRAPHHISLDPRRSALLNLFIFLQATPTLGSLSAPLQIRLSSLDQ